MAVLVDGRDSGAGTGHSVENIPNDNLVLSQPGRSLAKFAVQQVYKLLMQDVTS